MTHSSAKRTIKGEGDEGMIKGVRTLKYGEILPILGEIYREGETGTLLLQNGPSVKYLYFQGGQVIFAASNALEDKFTQILLEEGKIKEEQLEMATQKKGNKTIAKALTELGFISSSDLLDSLIKQVYRIVTSVIAWKEGSASFKPDVLPQGVAKLPLSTQRLILDLALAVDNRPWVLTVVGGMDKAIVIHKAEMDVALALPLTPEEEKIVKAIDGEKNIDEVASASVADPFYAVKLIIGLHFLGLAHPKRLIESVHEVTKPPESQSEEKHLDLSFLDQALPGHKKEEEIPITFEPISPAKVDTFEPRKINSTPAPKAEIKEQVNSVKAEVAEEPPLFTQTEEGKEALQPPLFNPAFLPAEEKNIFSSKRPKVILPPPNPLPRRSGGKKKYFIIPALTMLAIALLAGAYYIFFAEEEKAPPPPPPAVAKTTFGKEEKKITPVKTPQKEEVAPSGTVVNAEEGKKAESTLPVLELPQKATAEPSKLPVEKVEKKEPEPAKVAPPVAKEGETSPPEAKAGSKDPFDSMRSGDYDSAASWFKRVYGGKKGGYTIALMIACEKESIQKGFAGSGESKDFIIFPYNFKGRKCYRVVWGYYKTKGEAESAFASLPALFKDSGAKIVPFDSMRP